MIAFELAIEEKTNSQPFAIVSAEHFTYHKGKSIDPTVVLTDPTISLYCLDHKNRQALFVQTAPDVDLFTHPFYFMAQYEQAQRLIAVPYESLHQLAETVKVDPQRIILFYSTGRCGSTLFSHVLNLNPSILSYSEPDVFSQLVQMQTGGEIDKDETAALLNDCLLLMCAHAQAQGYQYYAFKFRSYVLSVSDLLHKMLPEAKVLFMYRNALTWAHSFSRAFGSSDAELNNRLFRQGWAKMTPSLHIYLNQPDASINWAIFLAHMWVSTMQDIQHLQASGANVTVIRFEALRASPHEIVERAMSELGLPTPASEQLDVVLAADSQAGTAGAQNKAKPARLLTDQEKRELSEHITKLDKTLAPDTIL